MNINDIISNLIAKSKGRTHITCTISSSQGYTLLTYIFCLFELFYSQTNLIFILNLTNSTSISLLPK